MLDSYRKMIGLLSGRQRRHLAVLLVLMLASGLLDLAGVASILPFLAVLSNPSVIEDRAGLSWLYDQLGFETTNGFLIFLGGLVFLLTLLSIGLRAATHYAVTLFSRNTAFELAVALLRRYLARPYEWFLSQHSADLGKSILEEVRQVVTNTLAPATKIIANVIIMLFLVGLLVYLDPLGAVAVAAVMGGAFGLIYLRLRRYLREIGKDRQVAVRERYQVTAEAVGGIKEVKLLGLESDYVRRFLDPSRRLTRHEASVALLGEMPRFVLEALAFGGILLFTMYLMWTRPGGINGVLPILGAYAFAGLKLMPVVQLLFKNAAMLRFGQAALDTLAADLRRGPVPKEQSGDVEPLRMRHTLRLEDVTYRYPGAGGPALSNVTLDIEAGTSVGVVGTSGAGKTTLIDVVLGLLVPQSGHLVVDGVRLDEASRERWQRGIGYVPQVIFLTAGTLAQNIAFGVPFDEIDHAAVRRAGELAGLADVVAGLPGGYETEIGENGVKLSGGQRQRIGIARALYRDPDIVVFDEATSALDSVSERAVMDALGALQGIKTVLMITHRVSSVAKFDRIFVLRGGRVIEEGDYGSLVDERGEFSGLLAAAQ